MIDRALKVWENSLEIQTLLYGALLSAVGLLQIESQILYDRLAKETKKLYAQTLGDRFTTAR